MLKFFVADQCTKRDNKNSQLTYLDVFDKNLHALLLQTTDRQGFSLSSIHTEAFLQ